MRKRLKNILCFIFVGIICLQSPICTAADSESMSDETVEKRKVLIYDFIPTSSRFIRLDDVYHLINMYSGNPNLDKEEAIDIVKKWTQKYVSISEDSFLGSADVIGEDGYIDYVCSSTVMYGSYSGGAMLLYSWWTDEEIYLNKPKEEIEKFIERTNSIAKKAREKIFFVRNHLEDDEYSSIYADSEGNVCVTLADETKASMLEQAGILWESTETTKSQMYENVQYLWGNREYLNIKDVRIYNDEETIFIHGYDEMEEFYKKLGDKRFPKDYYIWEHEYDSLEDSMLIFREDNSYNTLEEFLTKKTYFLDEAQLNSLKDCMADLIEEYPEYSYENLFTLVFQNAGDEDFLNFDSEIEEFTNKLVYYANEKNPFDEEAYGDSKRLLLKMVLQKYKGIYPEKSCQELYHTYGKEIAESRILSQQEKRSRYLWEIVKAGQLEAKQEKGKKQEKGFLYPAAGVCLIITIYITVVVIKRRMKNNTKASH